MKKRWYLFFAMSQLLILGLVLLSLKFSDKTADYMILDNKDIPYLPNKTSNTAKDEFTNSEEWVSFKWENEQKIITNRESIIELINRLYRVGKPIDKKSKELFIKLNDKNLYLKSLLETYESGQSDFELFKRKYTFEMRDFEMRLKVLLDDRSYVLL